MEARVGRLVTVLVGTLFLAVGVIALVAPRSPFTVYRQPVVVVATIALLLLGLLWRPPALVRRWCAWRWAALVVAVLGLVTGLVTGHSLRLPYSWDVRIVLQVAARLHAGTELTRYQQGYMGRYPNNKAMVALDRGAYAVSDLSGWRVDVILVTVAALGVAVTVWTVHRMVLPVAGPVRAVGAQLATVLLVAASPWVAIPYSDVLALPFLSGGLLLAMAAMRRRHDWWALLLAVAAGSSIAVAAVIKTIPYVVAVALLVTGLLAALGARADRREAMRWLAGTLAAVVALGVTALGVTAACAVALSDVPHTRATSQPLLWWVANGMTTTKSPGLPARYGGFNHALGSAIAGKTPEEASDWSAEYIRTQVGRRGLDGTARFYVAKAAWNWGDGMFWAWGEGQDARPDRLPPGEGLVGSVRDVDRPNGRWYALRSDLTQSLWLALLVVGGLGAVATRRPRLEVVLVALTVLGLTVFTLLFQGRSRYLFTFVPVIVSLVAMVHPAISARALSGLRGRGTGR
jgi:hypothetical protein